MRRRSPAHKPSALIRRRTPDTTLRTYREEPVEAPASGLQSQRMSRMNSLFDTGDESLSDDDLAAVRENAVARLSLWRKRSTYSGAGLLISCVAAVPFTAGPSTRTGSPLERYWSLPPWGSC